MMDRHQINEVLLAAGFNTEGFGPGDEGWMRLDSNDEAEVRVSIDDTNPITDKLIIGFYPSSDHDCEFFIEATTANLEPDTLKRIAYLATQYGKKG
jgi:hypothetical protein